MSEQTAPSRAGARPPLREVPASARTVQQEKLLSAHPTQQEKLLSTRAAQQERLLSSRTAQQERPLSSHTAPFLHSGDATRLRMLDAAIALLPICAGAIWFFRLQAGLLLVLSPACCIALEWLLTRGSEKDGGRGARHDGSALVSGLLLALLLPPGCPLWAVPLGALAAMGSKRLSGGLGRNLLNPAAVGRATLLLLPALRPPALRASQGSFLLGYLDGCLGELSSLLLLCGALYLALRRLLPLAILPAYLAASFLTALAIPQCEPLAVLAWGGTYLGACFLAADPVTSPMGRFLQTAYGLGCGAACTLLAYYGWGAGGVCCGILTMNFLGRLLELLIRRVQRAR